MSQKKEWKKKNQSFLLRYQRFFKICIIICVVFLNIYYFINSFHVYRQMFQRFLSIYTKVLAVFSSRCMKVLTISFLIYTRILTVFFEHIPQKFESIFSNGQRCRTKPCNINFLIPTSSAFSTGQRTWQIFFCRIFAMAKFLAQS